MTREEIIDGLEAYTVGRLNKDRAHITVEELQKFIDEIKALEQEPILDKILDKAKSEIRCGENKAYNADFTMGCEYALSVIERMLEEQVSTEKTGRWEWNQYDYNPNLGNWHCSECGSIAIECVPKKDPSGVPLYKYCPQCGCRLVEPQESEVEE